MTDPITPAIQACGLGRVFRVKDAGQSDVVALRGVPLTIPAGEVHGLLGPNGAGKTTLCKILATILTPTAGSASVGGHDVVAEADLVRRQLGLVLGGDRGLYTGLTSIQNLAFWAAMYGIGRRETGDRIAEVVSQVGFDDVTLKVERFSRGMKQRLHLARGLLAQPVVLILDEPTIGMDPRQHRPRLLTRSGQPTRRARAGRAAIRPGCRMAASASTPSTNRGPGRAKLALASTAQTGTPDGSTWCATSCCASCTDCSSP
jgi:ABC-type Na+ transport system ATPase subunit NatA